jgi:hypothetical protein
LVKQTRARIKKVRRSNKELWLSLLAVAVITAVYAFVVYRYRAIPAAGSLFGHLIGVAGFLLMLFTETLYSFRKRSRKAHWGPMAAWLQFHIFTGLVGPYMVLLHTSWKFNGLAGATTLLTILIVISGFVGRYIYTRIPRTLDGDEVTTSEGQAQANMLARTRRLFATWHAIHIPIGMALFTAAFIHIGAALYYATLLR